MMFKFDDTSWMSENYRFSSEEKGISLLTSPFIEPGVTPRHRAVALRRHADLCLVFGCAV
jgi:hypothetical protein